MALGLEMFRVLRKAKKEHEATTLVSYPSGLMPLDYLNGQRIQVFDSDNNIVEEYDSVGFVEGTMITVVADPGLGKTTLTQQIAVEICSQFDNSFIIHEDIEQSSHINRVYNITAQKPSWIKTHYALYQETHAESFIDRFMDHVKMKLNNRKEFEYDTGLKDMFGNPLKRLIPTVVIVDSLAVMRSEESSFNEEGKNKDNIDDTTNNMFGARVAKFNSEMFKQILPFAKKANIILFVINQINKKISTGFISKPRDLVGLGEDETISGGRASLYLANNVLRLKNKGTLTKDKDYGINGHIISAVFYKSRTNVSNIPVELIFDKAKGFSKTLSLLHFGFLYDIVKKQGNKYIIPGHEDTPFGKKTFCDVAAKNPTMINTLYELCLPHLQEFLGEESSDNSDDESQMDTYINIMNMLDD